MSWFNKIKKRAGNRIKEYQEEKEEDRLEARNARREARKVAREERTRYTVKKARETERQGGIWEIRKKKLGEGISKMGRATVSGAKKVERVSTRKPRKTRRKRTRVVYRERAPRQRSDMFGYDLIGGSPERERKRKPIRFL